MRPLLPLALLLRNAHTDAVARSGSSEAGERKLVEDGEQRYHLLPCVIDHDAAKERVGWQSRRAAGGRRRDTDRLLFCVVGRPKS